jgi:hypothetical protein
MTYATERDRVGREPVTIVELDLDKCAEVYGVSPCTATGGVGAECYNARQSCEDVANYNNTSTLTVKFSDRLIEGETYIDCIESSNLTPPAITPGQPFNKRASINIRLRDFPHHDRGLDPYVSTRSYIPVSQGTYFGKLLARNPYFQGRALRLKTGYVDETGTLQVQTQNFVIEDMFLSKDGVMTIVAKDILKLADDDRAQCPVASNGRLVDAISAVAASLTVTSGTESEYLGEYIRIGDEVIHAPIANRATNVFSNLTRGAWNTIADSFDIDTAVQDCKHFDAVNVVDIIEELLTDYASILSAYIPTADWATEKNNWLSGHNLTALITEPTGVKTLLDEISEQIMVYIWWDSINQEIPLKAIAPPVVPTVTLTDDNNFTSEPIVKTVPDDRKSRVLIYYKPFNPIEFDESKHFELGYGLISADEESADKYDGVRLKVIFARWITTDSVATQTGSRTRNQFRDPPKLITFMMDAKDSTNVIADYVNISTKQIQNNDGSNETVLAQILSVEEVTSRAPGTEYKFFAQQAQFSGRYGQIMASGAFSVYSSATDAEKGKGCYISAAGGANFSDNGEAYKIA